MTHATEHVTTHAQSILCSLDLIVGQVIRGQDLTPAERQRLVRAREYIDRLLDGRITKGTNGQDIAADIHNAARKVA